MARWSPQQIDPGRKRYTGDAAEVRMSPGVSQHIVREVYTGNRGIDDAIVFLLTKWLLPRPKQKVRLHVRSTSEG